MKITIRNPVRKELEVQGAKRVRDLLRLLDLNPESHIVIRCRELLTSDEPLSEDDQLEVVSAISGG
jgi:sulfur carrier protein